MNINRTMRYRMTILAAAVLTIALASTRLQADSGNCGGQMTSLPFMDVGSSPFFCQIAEAYFSGLTNGTSGTTYEKAEHHSIIEPSHRGDLCREARQPSVIPWASSLSLVRRPDY